MSRIIRSKGQFDASMSVISAVDKDHCIEERDHSPNQTEEKEDSA